MALAVAGVASDARGRARARGCARRSRARAAARRALRLAAAPLAGVPGLGALARLKDAATDARPAETADAAAVERLAEMGFDRGWCETALLDARGDVDAALWRRCSAARADAEAAAEAPRRPTTRSRATTPRERAAVVVRSAPRRTAPAVARLVDHDVVAIEQRGAWLRVRAARRGGGAAPPRDALYAAFQGGRVALSTGSVASTDDDAPAAPALHLLRRGLDTPATPAALSAENSRRRLRSDGVVLGSGFTPPEQQRAPSEVSAAPSEMTANVSDVGELLRGSRRQVREVTVQEELDDDDDDGGDDQGSLVEPAGSLIEDASAAPSVSATETEDATRTTAIDASVASFEPPARRARRSRRAGRTRARVARGRRRRVGPHLGAARSGGVR